MIVRALEKDKDPFKAREEGEKVLGKEYPYLSAIGALMYLTNNTKPDITFVVNYFARLLQCVIEIASRISYGI
jgi:hypothetical protein